MFLFFQCNIWCKSYLLFFRHYVFLLRYVTQITGNFSLIFILMGCLALAHMPNSKRCGPQARRIYNFLNSVLRVDGVVELFISSVDSGWLCLKLIL